MVTHRNAGTRPRKFGNIKHHNEELMGRLESKVALITGGARGNAEAIALRYAAEGADIVTCDIVPAEELDNTTGKAVRKTGRRALCFETDVSDESQVNDMVETAMAEFGKIDICVHVVGIAGPTQDIQHLTHAEWRNVLAVNVDSAFLVCRAVLPHMIERQTGRIILFSSATGKQPLPHRTPYAASKMGIIGLTRTLAAEVGRHKITVNAICPGGHPARDAELRQDWEAFTGLDSAGSFDVSGKQEEKRVLGGHWLATEGYSNDFGGVTHTAAMAVFLASDEASHFTGQDVNTTGGYIMW